MSADKLFDTTVSLLERVLDFAALRHNVLASNIANLNTPGYRARDLLFMGELQEAMAGVTSPGPSQAVSWNPNGSSGGASLRGVTPRLVYENAWRSTADGNTVDIDQEMRKLAENNLFYDVAAQLVARKLNMLKESIR